MDESKNLLAPILECTQAPVIVENLMDMAAAYQAKLDFIGTLPKDDEGMAAVKTLRAETRKEFEELDARRKEVKKKVMEPYNKAERIFKNFVTEPFNRLDEACKDFVNDVEGEMKTRCEEELKGFFTEYCAMKGIHWLKWEQLGIKVDMATARLKEPKKAMAAIREKVDSVSDTMVAINGMDDSADILAEYTQCLDMAKAVQLVTARKQATEIAQRSKEEWAARQMQSALVREALREAEVGNVVMPQQEKKFRVTFTVTATMPMLRGLKAFLEDKKYEYQEV